MTKDQRELREQVVYLRNLRNGYKKIESEMLVDNLNYEIKVDLALRVNRVTEEYNNLYRFYRKLYNTKIKF